MAKDFNVSVPEYGEMPERVVDLVDWLDKVVPEQTYAVSELRDNLPKCYAYSGKRELINWIRLQIANQDRHKQS